MTILFVTHYAGFYGANKSLYTLMQLLQEKHGVKPVVLLPKEGPMCARLQEAKIPFKVSHYYWWVNDNHGLFQWFLNKRKQVMNYVRIPKLCELFNNYSIDLVYTNSVCVNVGVFMSKRLRVPHIWHYREAFRKLGLKLSVPTNEGRIVWSRKETKVHILISDYMMNYYRPYLPNERMVRIYNGVDGPVTTNKRDRNVIKGRLKVACVGLISPQKNQLELLKAQVLLKNKGIEIETFFVGSGKIDYLSLIKSYINEQRLNDIAHLEGQSDDVYGILHRMNLGVVCAHDEAFGRTTIEFMQMHMPVVVSNSGANPELIEQGKTGAIYPLGAVEMLADAIENYVRHPELLQIHGDEASRIAKRDFSAERNADLIFKQIENCVKSKKN